MQQLVTNEFLHFFIITDRNQSNHVNTHARQQNNYIISYIDPLSPHESVKATK